MPKSRKDLLGIITYSGEFIPNLSVTTAPFRPMELDVEQGPRSRGGGDPGPPNNFPVID